MVRLCQAAGSCGDDESAGGGAAAAPAAGCAAAVSLEGTGVSLLFAAGGAPGDASLCANSSPGCTVCCRRDASKCLLWKGLLDPPADAAFA